MGQIIRQVFFIFFLLFALIGYSYFGPPTYTRYLTSNSLYRKYVGPAIDQMVLSGQQGSVAVGYLSEGRGDLSFRPSSELVFLPAREGQRFYGGTLVSSGEQSAATITLGDNSKLRLAENSTVYLEFPQGSMENGVIQLKVIKGTVEAEQTEADSKLKVKLVTPRGRVAKVEHRKLVVVAPTEHIDPRKRNPTQLLGDLQKPKREFVGLSDDAPAVKDIEKALIEGRALNVVQRREIFEKVDPELDAELTNLNRPVVKVDNKNVAALNSHIQLLEDTPAAAVAPATVTTPPPPAPIEIKKEEKPVAAVVAPPVVVKPVVKAVAHVAPPKRLVRAPASVEKSVEKLVEKSVEKPAEKVVEKPVEKIADKPVERRPQQIEERKAKPRVSVKNFEAPTSGSELSGAMYASKQGDKDTAKRLVASALTKSEYGTSSFNDATRFAVDELMQGYLDSGDCAQAKNTILNVNRAYPDNADSKVWAKKWRDVYKQKCQ